MRRLRIVSVAVLCLVGSLAAPPPAADAHTDVCAGQGTMFTGARFVYPGLTITPTTTSFFFGISTVGLCFSNEWPAASGWLSGFCGAATGYGTMNTGHRFRIDWVGDDFTLTPLDEPVFFNNGLIGMGTMEPDILNGQSCMPTTWGSDRFLLTGTWASPTHSSAPPPPPNYLPYAPTLVSPANNHTFAPADTQRFMIQASDPEGDSYQGRIRVREATTNVEVGIYFTERVPSGQQASATATPPLPPGNYTWVADATDQIAPTSFGSTSSSRSFTVDGPPPPPPQYPSDDCNDGGSTYADGFVDGTYLRLRSKTPTAGTTWVCFRAEANGVGLGGKVSFATGSTAAPGTPTVDNDGAACTSMSGNSLPPPHPTVAGSIGDPGDPSTYVPFTADVFASADRAAVCVSVGTTGRRVLVPMPQAGTPPSVSFEQDGTDPHTPTPTDNPSPVSGSCQAATSGTKAEYVNVSSVLGAAWLHTWQETSTKTHVCVRVQGPATTGGRFTIDTTGSGTPSPVTTTSTTDTTPCALRVAGIDNPTTVDLRRSTNLTDTSGVSFCVIVGTTKVRVTVGATGSAGVPQTTWTPDP